MICGKCGLTTLEGFRFCPRCGAGLEAPIKVDKSKLKGPRDAVMNNIRKRDLIDKPVPTLWIWVLLLIYVFLLVSSVAIGVSIAFNAFDQDPINPDMERVFEQAKESTAFTFVVGAIFYILTAALAYTVITRMNAHFDRDDEFREASLSVVSSGVSTPASKQLVGGDLYAMNQTDGLISTTERKRNAFLWAMIVALPLMVSALQWAVMLRLDSYDAYDDISGLFSLLSILTYIPILYLTYSLSKSIFDHHAEWSAFANQTTTAVKELGLRSTFGYWAPAVPSRPQLVYLVVTIVTLGFFMFYWWYTIIDDVNHHFAVHKDFEDMLAHSISE